MNISPWQTKQVYRQILLYSAIILTAFLFFGGPNYYSARSFKAVWNLGHLLYFSLLIYLTGPYLRKYSVNFSFRCLLILALALVIGTIIELIQSRFHRALDIRDIIRNLIGCMVGVFFLLPDKKTVQILFLRMLQVTTVFLVAIQIYPSAISFADEYLARRQFPTLSSFETPFEIDRWIGADIAVDDKISLTGNFSMRAQLNTDLYSGISLKYFPENWESFKKFQFSIYNPSDETLIITCRIHDLKHTESIQRYEDRFNHRFFLHQGWNTIETDIEDIRLAPDLRKMDLRHIRGVGFFATQLQTPRIIYIDDVKLI